MEINIKKILIDFVVVFALTWVVSAIVTFLWNLIRHGVGNSVPFSDHYRHSLDLDKGSGKEGKTEKEIVPTP